MFANRSKWGSWQRVTSDVWAQRTIELLHCEPLTWFDHHQIDFLFILGWLTMHPSFCLVVVCCWHKKSQLCYCRERLMLELSIFQKAINCLCALWTSNTIWASSTCIHFIIIEWPTKHLELWCLAVKVVLKLWWMMSIVCGTRKEPNHGVEKEWFWKPEISESQWSLFCASFSTFNMIWASSMPCILFIIGWQTMNLELLPLTHHVTFVLGVKTQAMRLLMLEAVNSNVRFRDSVS